MLYKIVHNLMRPRHFWRSVGMSELSELYASMLLRSLALSLIGLFVPIYLYKIGYSVQDVLGYFALFFVARIGLDLAVAFVVGRIGPKHTIVLSTIANIMYLVMLLSIRELHWPLPLLALVGSLTNSLFFIAFHTDFSKIKDINHGGKELGYMAIFERVGGVLGPLVGGLLASFTDPRYTIVLAISIFAASLIPLLATNETVKIHQHITFKGFSARKYLRHFVSYACHGAENTVSLILWPFFLALTIFTTNTYASIGAITALGTALSLLVAKKVGTFLDKKRGKKLLNFGVMINSALHAIRPLVSTPMTAIGVNLANDPVTLCYRMPFVKNYYDHADSLPGFRIVFIAVSESISACMRALFWGGLYIASLGHDPIQVIKFGFLLTGVFGLGIALQPRQLNN